MTASSTTSSHLKPHELAEAAALGPLDDEVPVTPTVAPVVVATLASALGVAAPPVRWADHSGQPYSARYHDGVVELGYPAAFPSVICHELAHHAAPGAGHGALFRGALVVALAVVFGPVVAERYRRACGELGLVIEEWRRGGLVHGAA